MSKQMTIGLVVPFAEDKVPPEGHQMYPGMTFLPRGVGVRSLTPEGYARRVTEIDNRLEEWLTFWFGRFESLDPEIKRLLKHVANHRDKWLVFLNDSEVPATNNHAERMLRPAVITRKIGGCNKTLLGALVRSVLARIMVTCQQQGQKFLDLARQLWSTSEPQAIPLYEPPPRPKPATAT